MVKENNSKFTPQGGTPGHDEIDIFAKMEDQKPSYLPPITPGDNNAIPNLKKKKVTPKIYDLTEQLKALEEEKA